jgi:hypothetical protein
MEAKDMTDALQNPNLSVPFAIVWDDNIAALTDLEAIFKLKLQQDPSPATQASPPTVVSRPIIVPLPNQILNLSMPNNDVHLI